MKTCSLFRDGNGTPIGGVVHGIECHGYKGRYSAWYDDCTRMIDAEDNSYRSGKAIRKGSPLWNAININSRHLFIKCLREGVDA